MYMYIYTHLVERVGVELGRGRRDVDSADVSVAREKDDAVGARRADQPPQPRHFGRDLSPRLPPVRVG